MKNESLIKVLIPLRNFIWPLVFSGFPSFQNFVWLPASFAAAVCQSYLQCEGDGLEGFGCHDSPLRVQEHPHQTYSSAGQSKGVLLSQPAPWTAAADQSYSRKSSLHRKVWLKRAVYSYITHFKTLISCCVSVSSVPLADLSEVLNRVSASLWLVTEAQRCPLVRAAYLSVAESLKRFCSETYISKLSNTLMHDLQTPQQGLQVGGTQTHTPKNKNKIVRGAL